MKYFATLILLSIAGTVYAQPSQSANPESTPQATLEWRHMINGMEPSDPALQQEIRKLEQAGTPEATAMLGYLYLNGKGVEQDYSRVASYAQEATGQGNGFAHYLMGKLYRETEHFGEPDMERARQHYQIAADKGDPFGMVNLGVIYYEGYGVDVDIHRAIRWFEQAGEQGSPTAFHNIGQAHYYGRGVLSSDPQTAYSYYLKAAEKGYASSQVKLGDMYLAGEVVEQSRDNAYEWYLAAAEQGHVDGQFKLAEWYYAVGDKPFDKRYYREAAEWYSKAADQGHTEAQYMAGSIYIYNLWEEKGREGIAYLKQAAESGHAPAQTKLGERIWQYLIWEESYGKEDYEYVHEFLEISPDAAYSWLRKAILQGSGDAMYHMGKMYEDGFLDLPINTTAEEQMFYWFNRSCETGDDTDVVRGACSRLKYLKYDRVKATLEKVIDSIGYPAHPDWEEYGTNETGVYSLNPRRIFDFEYIDGRFILSKIELHEPGVVYNAGPFNFWLQGFVVNCSEQKILDVYETKWTHERRVTRSNNFSSYGYENEEAWSDIPAGTYYENLYVEACEGE